MILELISNSPEETQQLGHKIGGLLKPGDWIGLTGELGAGKTCLTQGIAQGAGVAASVPVTSPTFIIHQTYPGRIDLYHLDLYRLSSFEELHEIGYLELVTGDGACVVEWFEKIKEAVPDQGLVISLEIVDEKESSISVSGIGKRGG
ncbi:MAG: tRNA (adenosine(37)-N6)-threonylcarbamoyltransferase complex ATPase subunit type 1 TsaE, partial [Deltaproteobacteria bacterium]|nr:tRNA (adenosine(37)-N6)-threonylcarbamoyltransferase complex ATPase subunit type 1 TsaE [Deltaproteobacteria bacterium]